MICVYIDLDVVCVGMRVAAALGTTVNVTDVNSEIISPCLVQQIDGTSMAAPGEYISILFTACWVYCILSLISIFVYYSL